MTDATPATDTPGAESSPADAPSTAALDELTEDTRAGEQLPLATLLDVTLPVTIEFGSTRMTVQEVLGLGCGSVIQLDRSVGEPVDVYVSDRKLAEGEVVVIGEHFGVRLTQVMNTTDTAGTSP